MDFECFMEEQIIIREEIKIDQEYDKTSKYAQSGRAVEQALETTVGRKTAEGGEIFNDYNTNKALSAFATAKGSNNIAGGKCFKVIADPIDNGDGTGVYTLDSVEGLEVGMRYSTFLQTQSVDAGKITAIDTNTKTITVNGFVYYPLNEYADDPKNLNITNSLLITGRPDLGTTDIGFTAFIGGKGNFAQNTHTLAFGEGNYVLGKYGTAFGIKNVASYNSFVAGQDNRNLGATSFVVGANNTATANRAFVTGQSNKVTAPNSFVGGQNTTINGINSLGYGSWNTVTGDNAGCFGSGNQVKGKNSFAAGSSLVALQDNQCVIGVKNSYNGSSDALFIIGNGSNVKGHSNAFTVHKDGHAELETMGETDNSVATKGYVDNKTANLDNVYGDIAELSEQLITAQNDIEDCFGLIDKCDEEVDVFSTDLAAVSTEVTELKTDIEEVLDYILASQASYLGGV